MRSRNLLLLSCILGLYLVGCASAPPLWGKPGTTEADLDAAMNECDQRHVASRLGIRDPFIREDPVFNPVRRYGGGASALARDLCLEKQGWIYQE